MQANDLFRSRLAYALAGTVAVAALARADARSVTPELASTPVTVSNPISRPALTHEVDNPAEFPFATRVYPTPNQVATFIVPAGKRLVITSVSGYAGSTTVLDITVEATFDTTSYSRVIPFGTVVGGISYLSQPAATLVADPGTTVYFVVDDSNSSDGAGVNIDVFGYYTSY